MLVFSGFFLINADFFLSTSRKKTKEEITLNFLTLMEFGLIKLLTLAKKSLKSGCIKWQLTKESWTKFRRSSGSDRILERVSVT